MTDFSPALFNQVFDQLKRQEFPAGSLYIVATPIGNLADITFRAAFTLSLVDGIACEDTRHSQVLLNQLGIHKPLLAIHEHNEREASAQLIKNLQQGQRWAYISDAGTPGISDPGAKLVDSCVAQNIRILPIPGPSAVASLASVAGRPIEFSQGRFQFLGFIPTKGKEQNYFLELIEASPLCSVFYEAPQRIHKTLASLQANISDQSREIVIGRELTKKFETITRLKVSELTEWIKADEESRGEFVVMVSGATASFEQASPSDPKVLALANSLSKVLGSKQIAEILSEHFAIPKKEAYQIALHYKQSDE
jgi:16S rRNA (cytidine1402-2'-O)-methyltransferase